MNKTGLHGYSVFIFFDDGKNLVFSSMAEASRALGLGERHFAKLRAKGLDYSNKGHFRFELHDPVGIHVPGSRVMLKSNDEELLFNSSQEAAVFAGVCAGTIRQRINDGLWLKSKWRVYRV